MGEAAHTEGWLDEVRSAYLYRVIAEVERGSPRSTLFLELAREAEGQAAIWAKNAGLASVPAFVPDLRSRIVAGLVRRYGARAMRGVLAAMKVRGLSVYSHATPGHPAPTSVEEVGKRHRGFGAGGNLRAAVFGINDGLVSNLSLILGVAGASSNTGFILLSGIAGLLAGAFSMAAGEYVSVRSQREMYEHQIGLEQAELDEYPDEEAEELALIYAARGMNREDAHALATRTIADPRLALDTLAREELGLNPEDLGSPWGAALSSFFAFGVGALVPLAPFLIARAEGALIAAVAVTGAALFGVGAVISLFTGRSAVRDGLRMLAIGGGAGTVTYLVGMLLGVSLS
ncbi:MAG TPA: VIT1/CCC1 transporter family protein [Burkholderiales bacterium]|nr:VIT1/CCC1 transporter family protein [Burkholderiales bacterium]